MEDSTSFEDLFSASLDGDLDVVTPLLERLSFKNHEDIEEVEEVVRPSRKRQQPTSISAISPTIRVSHQVLKLCLGHRAVPG